MNLNLFDIKGLSTVPDNSFYIFIFLSIVMFVFVIAVFKMIRYKTINKKLSFKDIARIKLENIDLNDTKNSAYIISKYARVLIHDQRSKRLYEELYISLEKYKYTQLVPPFEKDTLAKLHLFQESVGMI